MKIATCCSCLMLLFVSASASAEEPATADLARLIHKLVVAKVPAVHEDDSGWGHTAPLPERLKLPRIRRTLVQVGDHMEAPDGPWRKLRLRMEDPKHDISIRVPSFKSKDAQHYQLVVEADALVRTEADVQLWKNGLQLSDLTARADVSLTVRVECDVAARLETKDGPPRLVLVPDIKELKLTLKEFTPRQVTFHRAGVTVEGDAVETAGKELKESVQTLLKSLEPQVKKRAGEAVAKALKDGKDPLPAGDLLKAVAPLLKKN